MFWHRLLQAVAGAWGGEGAEPNPGTPMTGLGVVSPAHILHLLVLQVFMPIDTLEYAMRYFGSIVGVLAITYYQFRRKSYVY
ncbi:hypothetical protein NITLEN_90146 [Nitrospira lenta]|uniref:Uncharacterized protein n=1 Tax=Nitrospira lenta TaxID=1436998 RepID=A0A330LC09_9BACT|nr:hypothetical protein NITLEN_90146 [Nitrospira lenta]